MKHTVALVNIITTRSTHALSAQPHMKTLRAIAPKGETNFEYQRDRFQRSLVSGDRFVLGTSRIVWKP